jgi:hypothetical protein
MIMAGRTRVPARPLRAARLLIGPNRLRRPSDRLEGLIAVLLSAAFLVAVAAAPAFGGHLYRSQRADGSRLHVATAVLAGSGPSGSYVSGVAEAAARWRAPDGQQRRGILSTVTAPGISGAPAGARVRAARGPACERRRGGVLRGRARHRRGVRRGDRAAHLLLAGPAGARPAPPGGVGVGMVADRAAMDDPPLIRVTA